MIIDVHTHITFGGNSQFMKDLGRHKFNATTLVNRMDMEGIDKSIVLPLTNPENQDMFAVTNSRETLQACKKHPDRLIPFCNIDPRAMLNTPDADLSIIMKAYKDLGCMGIGEICANISITDPRYQNLFHHAEKQRMPMIFHFTGRKGAGYGVIDKLGLPGLAMSLKNFPKAIFLGHSPCFWNEIDGNLTSRQKEGYPKGLIKKQGMLWTLFTKNQNLYGDLSAGSAHNAIARDPKVGVKFLKKFHKQLCFGTDRFTNATEPVPPILIYIRKLREEKTLTKVEFDNIMYKNAQRILR